MSESQDLVLSREQLQASCDLVKQKLDKVRRYLLSTYAADGRLGIDHQYAIRVIDSRKREMDRIFIIKTRGKFDPDRLRAEIEMEVAHRDLGELFRWGGFNHGYGRLGCGGCAYDYVMQGALNLKVVQSRPCLVCGQGIAHSAAADGPEELQALMASLPVRRLDVGPTQGDIAAYNWPVVVYGCDVCGSVEVGR